MGTGSSSSKDHPVVGLKAELPPKSKSRKFQSYHLPFVKRQKGFSRLRRSLFGQKKPKSGGTNYERTLALLSSGCEPNSKLTPDPTAPIVYESRPTTDDHLRGLDYQLYYRTWGSGFLLTRSPPSHFSLIEGGLHSIDCANYDDEDELRTCDAISLPDVQLIGRSNAIHDAYSAVIKRPVVVEKPVKIVRSVSGSLHEVHTPTNNDISKGRIHLSPRIAATRKLESLSPRIVRLSGGSPNVSKSRLGIARDNPLRSPGATPRIVHMLPRLEKPIQVPAPVLDKKPETNLEVTSATRVSPLVPQTDESKYSPMSELIDPINNIPVIVPDEQLPSYLNPDEGELLLKDIAEKEQRIDEKLSQVQSMLVNCAKNTSNGFHSSPSDSSGERSGSVDDDMHDKALCGSQSSDAIVSIDSPWEEMDQPHDLIPRTATKEVEISDEGTSTVVPSAVHVQLKSSEQLNISSEVQDVAIAKHSSPSSSCDEIKNCILTDDSQLVCGPQEICSKLIEDLMTNLEVDLSDFQKFIKLDAQLDVKYQVLPIEALLRECFFARVTVDDLSRSLRVLAKYGLNLLKVESERPKYWNKIVSTAAYQSPAHWLSIKGIKDILIKLGYREVGTGLVYATALQPERSVIAHWVIELLLASYELNAHSLGSHPKAEMFQGHDQQHLREAGNGGKQFDSIIGVQPIYENFACAAQFYKSDGSAEPPKDMFGRKPVVPWLSDKENRVTKDTMASMSAFQCGLCGSSSPAVRCEKCSNQIFCLSCDDMYHRHPKRLDHVRKLANAPMLPPPRPPPKTIDPTKIPVPPPRRKKSQQSSPPFERKQFEQKPELPKKQFPLKFGSLKRFMPNSFAGRPPATPTAKEPRFRTSSGQYPSSEYPNQQRHDDCSGRSSDTSQFQHRPSSSRRFNVYPYYYDEQRSNQAELSSSDPDEEIRSGRGSSSSYRGSGSSVPPRPPLPNYSGMAARPPINVDVHRQMNNPNVPMLSRRNTMMTRTLGRSSPFMMGRLGPSYMQMSNSVCDLTHPMMSGYPLPQVQSMADLHCGVNPADGMPMMTAPCGCRPNWIGPDPFGMWHPPVRCMMHSSTASLYPLTPTQADGLMYSSGPQSSKPCYNPNENPFPTTTLERRSSPADSHRSSGSRRRPKRNGVVDEKCTSVREGGNRKHRTRNAAYRQKAPDSSSDDDVGQDDYFSAGTSDDNDPDDRPDGSWECEHCTFINAPESRICNVCCKTAVKPSADKRGQSSPARPKKINDDLKNINRRPKKVASGKDDGVYEDLDDIKPMAIVANADDDVKILSDMMEQGFKNKKAKEKQPVVTNQREVEGNRSKVVNETIEKSKKVRDLKVNQLTSKSGGALETKSGDGFKINSGNDFVEKSEEGLESRNMAIQVEVQTDFPNSSKAVSNDLTIENLSVGSRNVTSTGTSPPPQSISTQTIDDHTPWNVPLTSTNPSANTTLHRTSSRQSLGGVNIGGTDNESSFGMPLQPSSSTLKRTASLHFQHGSGLYGVDSTQPYMGSTGYNVCRTGSRTSLMSDHPFGYSSGPPSRDVSPPRSFLSRRDSERAYPGYSRFGQSEDRGFLPRCGSRKDYYLSLEELVERRRHETMRNQGLELVRLLREAENHNFTADDLQAALNHCGSQNPVQWLQDNWRNMVDTVATLSTNYGRDKKENNVGIVSTDEAKDALRIHKGNIWAAVTECAEQRQRKVNDLLNRGNFTRDEVLDALTVNLGNVEATLDDLNRTNMKPFLMRIWGPSAGVDNGAGSGGSGDLFVKKQNLYEKYQINDNGDQANASRGFVNEEVSTVKSEVSSEIIGSTSEDEESDDEQQVKDIDVQEDEEEDDDDDDEEEEEEEEEEDCGIDESAAASPKEEFYDTINVSPLSENVKPQLEILNDIKTSHNAVPSPEVVTVSMKSDAAMSPISKEKSPSPTKTFENKVTRQSISKQQDSLTSEFNRRVRQLMAEGKVDTYERAEIVVKLIDLRFEEKDAIAASGECSNVYMAVSYLQQECELCAGKFPMEGMVSMLFCVHSCCRDCTKDYFTLMIKERTIMEMVCPFCNEPNLNDENIASDYFNNLDILLKNLIDREVHEIFQCKLRDRALMSDPNFHWCAKCASGFISEPNQKRLACPDCRAESCALCKKPWERQHDGISCERFAQWKEANDPEYQAVGLEKYLAENGIDCPKCKFKYALAKGGCMHFTCCQCRFEFCSGCGRHFKMSENCTVSPHCKKLGLHAHHPRNCLFYLRDKDPKELQKLLDDNCIPYNVNPSDTMQFGAGVLTSRCPVMEQKELPHGNEDAFCDREVEVGHAGICRFHYIEYLVSLINKHHIDPVCIMEMVELQQELRRADKSVPEKRSQELDSVYNERLVQMIVSEIPLEEA